MKLHPRLAATLFPSDCHIPTHEEAMQVLVLAGGDLRSARLSNQEPETSFGGCKDTDAETTAQVSALYILVARIASTPTHQSDNLRS